MRITVFKPTNAFQAAIANTLDGAQLPTLLVSTSTGSLQLVEQDLKGSTKWIREESLSDIAVLRFINLGEPEVEVVRDIMAEEGFVGRIARQLAELKVSQVTAVTGSYRRESANGYRTCRPMSSDSQTASSLQRPR
jgi:hypothetical protein